PAGPRAAVRRGGREGPPPAPTSGREGEEPPRPRAFLRRRAGFLAILSPTRAGYGQPPARPFSPGGRCRRAWPLPAPGGPHFVENRAMKPPPVLILIASVSPRRAAASSTFT